MKTGRPPKPDAEKRTVTLQVRLTQDELELLEKVSSDAKTSSWARDELLKLARRKLKREGLA